MVLNDSNPASAPVCVALSKLSGNMRELIRNGSQRLGALSRFSASHGARAKRSNAINAPTPIAARPDSIMTLPAGAGSL